MSPHGYNISICSNRAHSFMLFLGDYYFFLSMEYLIWKIIYRCNSSMFSIVSELWPQVILNHCLSPCLSRFPPVLIVSFFVLYFLILVESIVAIVTISIVLTVIGFSFWSHSHPVSSQADASTYVRSSHITCSRNYDHFFNIFSHSQLKNPGPVTNFTTTLTTSVSRPSMATHCTWWLASPILGGIVLYPCLQLVYPFNKSSLSP